MAERFAVVLVVEGDVDWDDLAIEGINPYDVKYVSELVPVGDDDGEGYSFSHELQEIVREFYPVTR